MRRRMFGILALMSLLLFAAVVWMWVRSFGEDRALLGAGGSSVYVAVALGAVRGRGAAGGGGGGTGVGGDRRAGRTRILRGRRSATATCRGTSGRGRRRGRRTHA